MSRRREHEMDELPDLQSDADVDALMARLRARIDSGPPARPAFEVAPSASPGDGLGDLLAAQDVFAAAVVRAMALIADTLEEVAAAGRGAAASPRAAARLRGGRRTTPRRKP